MISVLAFAFLFGSASGPLASAQAVPPSAPRAPHAPQSDVVDSSPNQQPGSAPSQLARTSRPKDLDGSPQACDEAAHRRKLPPGNWELEDVRVNVYEVDIQTAHERFKLRRDFPFDLCNECRWYLVHESRVVCEPSEYDLSWVSRVWWAATRFSPERYDWARGFVDQALGNVEFDNFPTQGRLAGLESIPVPAFEVWGRAACVTQNYKIWTLTARTTIDAFFAESVYYWYDWEAERSFKTFCGQRTEGLVSAGSSYRQVVEAIIDPCCETPPGEEPPCCGQETAP